MAEAAAGVAGWRQRLQQGAVWRDEEGCSWPEEGTVRSGWQELLREKGGGNICWKKRCFFFGKLLVKSCLF